MWNFVTLSMPNSKIEPQGKGDRIRDATLQRLARFRRRGLHVRAAQHRHHLPDRALGRAHFRALDVVRCHDLRLGVERAGIVDEAEAEFRVLHLLLGIGAVPGIERLRAFLAIAEHEGDLAGRDDREAAGLVAGIDVSDVGNAVARHVVMVDGLAELLGRKDRGGNRAARRVGDVVGPDLCRGHQRMRGRHPDRNLQIDGLVLRARWRGAGEDGQARSACRDNKFHGLPPRSAAHPRRLLCVTIDNTAKAGKHASKHAPAGSL